MLCDAVAKGEDGDLKIVREQYPCQELLSAINNSDPEYKAGLMRLLNVLYVGTEESRDYLSNSIFTKNQGEYSFPPPCAHLNLFKSEKETAESTITEIWRMIRDNLDPQASIGKIIKGMIIFLNNSLLGVGTGVLSHSKEANSLTFEKSQATHVPVPLAASQTIESPAAKSQMLLLQKVEDDKDDIMTHENYSLQREFSRKLKKASDNEGEEISDKEKEEKALEFEGEEGDFSIGEVIVSEALYLAYTFLRYGCIWHINQKSNAPQANINGGNSAYVEIVKQYTKAIFQVMFKIYERVLKKTGFHSRE